MKKLLGILVVIVLIISIVFNASSNLSADFCEDPDDPETCNTSP